MTWNPAWDLAYSVPHWMEKVKTAWDNLPHDRKSLLALNSMGEQPDLVAYIFGETRGFAESLIPQFEKIVNDPSGGERLAHMWKSHVPEYYAFTNKMYTYYGTEIVNVMNSLCGAVDVTLDRPPQPFKRY